MSKVSLKIAVHTCNETKLINFIKKKCKILSVIGAERFSLKLYDFVVQSQRVNHKH